MAVVMLVKRILTSCDLSGRDVGTEEEPASDEQRIERSKALVFEDAVFVSISFPSRLFFVLLALTSRPSDD